MSPLQEDFEILGETPDLLAVNKPAGMLVHPTKPDGPWTLWDGLRELLRYELANGGQVSLINRLDRETSGIVLVAKSSRAARTASISMQEGKIKKLYLAIVCGWPEDKFESEAPIIRLGEVAASEIHLMRAVHPSGARAHTRFRVVSRIERSEGRFALVSAEPLTGRTHQIRVHLAHCGHPVVGDKLYGPSPDRYLEFIRTGWTPALAERLLLRHHALHSAELALEWNGVPLIWTSGLPAAMQAFLGAGNPAPA
ncbi:MAG: RluA family pseudouridine synthase [Verrucomicrobia bacterium]|nr:RluA family pseudouridine synthase [Verrucomicrobiota bacterium]